MTIIVTVSTLVIPGPRSGTRNPEHYMDKLPCVYMLASKPNGTLYVSVTSDLIKRVWQHRSDMTQGFTSRYGVHVLVWHEVHQAMESAILREKELKKWRRQWKVALIEIENPLWRDLYPDII